MIVHEGRTSRKKKRKIQVFQGRKAARKINCLRQRGDDFKRRYLIDLRRKRSACGR